MSETVIYSLIAIGVIAIIGLSIYIYRQYRFIKTKQAQQREQLARLEAQRQEKYTYVVDSLKILAHALQEEQVGPVEASIRIRSLLDYYDASLHQQAEYQVFDEVFRETEHIPILEAWKALDRKTRRKFERDIEQIEQVRGDAVKAAAKQLLVLLNQPRH